MVLASPRAAEPAQGPPVVWLGWDDYLAWLGGKKRSTVTAWGERVTLGPPMAPGMHGALIAPTGEGKTTHAVGVLGLRKYVLALDPKGEDETQSASGYYRVRSIHQDSLRWRMAHRDDARTWDAVHRAIDEGRPARVIVGGGASTDEQDRALQQLMRESIVYCRHSGGWTLYCDEFELLSSQRMFDLGPAIERMLITARRAKTSVITSYQAQAWVSTHAHRQASRVTMWQTGSRAMIKNIAEGMGHDWRHLAAAIDQLPKWHSLTIPRGRHDPMVITRAPKVN